MKEGSCSYQLLDKMALSPSSDFQPKLKPLLKSTLTKPPVPRSNLGFLVYSPSSLKMTVLSGWLSCAARDGDTLGMVLSLGNCRIQGSQMWTEAEVLPLTTGTWCSSSSWPACFPELLICTQCSVLCWETAGGNQFRSLQTGWASEMIQVAGPDYSLCMFPYLPCHWSSINVTCYLCCY